MADTDILTEGYKSMSDLKGGAQRALLADTRYGWMKCILR